MQAGLIGWHDAFATPNHRLIPDGENRDSPPRLALAPIGREASGDAVEDFEQIRPIWAMHEVLTVQDAAALIAGVEPTCVQYNQDEPAYFSYFGGGGNTNGPAINDVRAALKGITAAIINGKLKATIRRDGWSDEDQEFDQAQTDSPRTQGFKRDATEAPGARMRVEGDRVQSGGTAPRPNPSWALTTIERADLKGWLREQGYATGFLFPDAKPANIPGYLDPDNPRYAPKLAAAVSVWQAMEDENLRRTKTPPQAMIAWLESRYAEFGLTHKQSGKNAKGATTHKIGDRNDGAIEQVAKVANWEAEGGAPKTPG